jgi:hypothetical protein
VTIQNLNKSVVQNTMEFIFHTFDIQNVGKVPSAGDYSVTVKPFAYPSDKYSPCLGKAELKKVTFYSRRAWVTGLNLVGFGFHFNMADAMGLNQFCENCSSIFSPAHDRAFLGIAPVLIGKTDDPAGLGLKLCVYNITQTGAGDGTPNEVVYKNGQPSVPADNAQLYSANSAPPFWNMYNDDKVTVTVTISAGNDAGPGYINCHILGGKITKTITFSKNPKSPKVTK